MKSTYMTPQEWRPPTGLPPIPRRVNIYIIQALTEVNKNNEEKGTGHREITSQNQCINNPLNYRKLSRLKCLHNQLWFDIEGVADTEYAMMMLEAYIVDTTNMTVLYKSGHHLQYGL